MQSDLTTILLFGDFPSHRGIITFEAFFSICTREVKEARKEEASLLSCLQVEDDVAMGRRMRIDPIPYSVARNTVLATAAQKKRDVGKV